MKITEEQLNSYLDLYQRQYGITLDRITGLMQFRKLINLVALLTLPKNMYSHIVCADEAMYNKGAVQKENLHKEIDEM